MSELNKPFVRPVEAIATQIVETGISLVVPVVIWRSKGPVPPVLYYEWRTRNTHRSPAIMVSSICSFVTRHLRPLSRSYTRTLELTGFLLYVLSMPLGAGYGGLSETSPNMEILPSPIARFASEAETIGVINLPRHIYESLARYHGRARGLALGLSSPP